MRRGRLTGTVAALAAGVLLAACGGDDDNDPVTLTLLTYDSFPESDTGLNAALAEFPDEEPDLSPEDQGNGTTI